MPNKYIAPYLISTDRPPNVPSTGTFTVPVCTTSERFDKITNALFAYGAMQGNEFDFDHLIDWLDACPRITEGCITFDNQCRAISKDDTRITWYPARDAETLPAGYVVNPWVTLTGDNPLVGLKLGDVITDIPHIPPLPTIWDHLEDIGTILALGYPSITISGLIGNGKIRVYLVGIILGGRVITVTDNNLLSIAFVDTNIDSASLPPETYAENILEFDFEGDVEHTLNLVFVPNVSADIEFLGYGGGFRRFEICGFGESTMPPEACCDETNELLRENNSLISQILLLLGGGFKIVPLLSGIPDESGGKCAPDHFDHDGDSETELELTQRRQALCITIERYIKGIVLAALRDMGAPSFVVDYIQSVLVSDLPLSLSALEVSYPVGFSGLSVFFLLASTVASFEALLCLMLEGLTGDKNNTFANFKESLPDIAPEGFPEGLAPLLFLVRRSNSVLSNYKAFNLALNDAKEEELDAYECPCEEPMPEEPVIVPAFDISGTPLPESADLVITNLGGGNYRFEQNTATGAGRYAVMFKDQYDRCLHMGAPTAGQGSLAAFSYFYTDCAGVYHGGTGGGRPDAIISGEDYDSPADVGWLITLV